MKIKSEEDFWTGVMFIGFGILAIMVSREYPMGSARAMGPGYFPTYLGIIIIAIGAALMSRAFWVEGEGIGGWGWRPFYGYRRHSLHSACSSKEPDSFWRSWHSSSRARSPDATRARWSS
jgi:hypothetical protein